MNQNLLFRPIYKLSRIDYSFGSVFQPDAPVILKFVGNYCIFECQTESEQKALYRYCDDIAGDSIDTIHYSITLVSSNSDICDFHHRFSTLPEIETCIYSSTDCGILCRWKSFKSLDPFGTVPNYRFPQFTS